MTDSMIWNAMTTSMQLAQECLKEGPSTGEEQAEASPPFEGLESFAQTIESGMYIIISVHVFQVQYYYYCEIATFPLIISSSQLAKKTRIPACPLGTQLSHFLFAWDNYLLDLANDLVGR